MFTYLLSYLQLILKAKRVKKIFTGNWVHAHGVLWEFAAGCGGHCQSGAGMTGVKLLKCWEKRN